MCINKTRLCNFLYSNALAQGLLNIILFQARKGRKDETSFRVYKKPHLIRTQKARIDSSIYEYYTQFYVRVTLVTEGNKNRTQRLR
jgi:hypothetical protein